MLIKLLEKVFNPLPQHKIEIRIQFVSADLTKVEPFFDGELLYDKVIEERWKLRYGNKRLELFFRRHPKGDIAILNSTVVPAELATLCFDVFFEPTDEVKATRLAIELSKFK